ncbi:hypothetical protein ES708_01986 [subsurface metagenome]
MKSRLDREKDTIGVMIRMYCRYFHQTKSLCLDCLNLYDYSVNRIKCCPFGREKPVCTGCMVHCYKSDKREEIRRVMRLAGPRMILSHPVKAIDYFLAKRRLSDKRQIFGIKTSITSSNRNNV